MGATENSIEMEQVKVEEIIPLNSHQNAASLPKELNHETNGVATMEIDETKVIGAKKEKADEPLEEEFYGIIFAILLPYILIGCPFNHCLEKANQNVCQFTTAWPMKIYTCLISFLAHALLVVWVVRSAVQLFSTKQLNEELIKDLFMLSYILAGVVALDIIWIHRSSIIDVLSNLLVYWPLGENAKYRSLFTLDIGKLKYYRLKFTILLVLSYGLALLLVVYYFWLGYIIVRAYTDSDPEGFTHWWRSVIEIVSIYTLFFFASNAILLLSFIWAAQYKIKHLILFIQNLIKSNERPDVSDVEIVKTWYQNILKTVSSIDRVFSFYIVAYIGFLFLGIIYHVSRLVDIFQTGGVENVRFLYVFGISVLMSFLLFYGLKEFSDCFEHSSACKSILYDYVLSSHPDERSTAFFQEVNFVTQGLLSKPATFTLFGQINLNKSFLVHMVLVIYSYAVLFHQFTQKHK